ncbi:MAG TPA: hypothetical protein VFS20_25050 [Longimicrobium sp.]|nr:hypothetical protein [Longimicrobium sp.]
MRLRSFVTLLACGALAACGGDNHTILPTPAGSLAGFWRSNERSVLATFSNVDRPVLARVHLGLGPNGQFRRELRYVDPVSGLDFPEAISEGTYTASSGNAQVTITRDYVRLGGTPQTNPVPQPTPSRTENYTYSLQDGVLTFRHICPINALCGEDPFPKYTAVLPD